MDFISLTGSKVNAENSKGDTPLILATKLKNYEVVEVLCKQKSLKISHKNVRGKTALHYAVALNHAEIAFTLMQEGGSVLVADNHGYTPVHTACKYGREELLIFMFDKLSSPIDSMTIVQLMTNDGKTPFLVARCALNYSIMIIKILIEKKSDLSTVDHFRNTALHLFGTKDDIDACTMILRRAKELNIELLKEKNINMETPLHVAASFGHLNVCRHFMEK